MNPATTDIVSPFDWIATAITPQGGRFTFDLPAEALLAIKMEFSDGEAELLRDFAASFTAAVAYFGFRQIYTATANAIGETDHPTSENWLLAFIGWDMLLTELRSLGMAARVVERTIFQASVMHLWALNTAANVVTHILASAIEETGGAPFKPDTELIEMAHEVILATQAAADELEHRLGSPFSSISECN